MGYSPWGRRESGTTGGLTTHTHTREPAWGGVGSRGQQERGHFTMCGSKGAWARGDIMGACQALSRKEGAIQCNGGPGGNRARTATGTGAVGGIHTPTALSFHTSHAGAFDWPNPARRQGTRGPSLGTGGRDWDIGIDVYTLLLLLLLSCFSCV